MLGHISALGSQRLLSLLEAMEAVSLLECFDPRDKLYGIMSLVDWTGLQKPQPNYDSDIFDLAVETMRALALSHEREPELEDNESGTESDSSEPDHPDRSAMRIAKRVLNNFELSAQSNAKISASIERRSKGCAAKSGNIDRSLIRYHDTFTWSGYELLLDINTLQHRDPDDSERSGARRHAKLKYEDGVLTDSQGIIRGLLPSSTKSGEWLVSHKHRSLVIRRRPDGRYDIIGQGLWENVLTPDFRDEGRFRIHFHVKDLLALAQNDIQMDDQAESHTDVSTSSESLVVRDQELLYLRSGLSYANRI